MVRLTILFAGFSNGAMAYEGWIPKKLMIKLLHLKQLQPADFAAFGQTKTLDEQETFFLNFRG